MIELIDNSDKKKRKLNGIQFVDGKATVDDHMLGKARLVCKYYNVSMKMEMNIAPGEEDPVDESAPGQSTVGPESVDSVEKAEETKNAILPG